MLSRELVQTRVCKILEGLIRFHGQHAPSRLPWFRPYYHSPGPWQSSLLSLTSLPSHSVHQIAPRVTPSNYYWLPTKMLSPAFLLEQNSNFHSVASGTNPDRFQPLLATARVNTYVLYFYLIDLVFSSSVSIGMLELFSMFLGPNK